MHKEVTLESEPKVFGFWIYLLTDLIIFAVLFGTYVVLRNGTFGGPGPKDLFQMPFVLAETLILLFSSFTCSLGLLSVHQEKKKEALIWYGITFLLGLTFLVLEIYEFQEFVHEGAPPQRSGFLSSFFILVGTHGFHITVGLLWMAVEMYRIATRTFNAHSVSRIFRMALFWHFLDFVWIFIFTVVYAMGVLI